MEPVVLRTERLKLSVPVARDVDAIYAACQDPGIQRYTGVPQPYERSHASGFIDYATTSWEKENEITWAVRLGTRLAGMIGVIRTGDGAGELGYWMTPEYRGQGLLTEAARAVIEWSLAPDGLDLTRLEWKAVAGNLPSARAARTLGFRYEGLMRQGLTSPNGRDDGWIAAILKDDDRMPRPWSVLED